MTPRLLNTTRRAALLTGLIGLCVLNPLLGCAPEEIEYIGLIPREEFESAALPTYQEFLDAYEAVLEEDPELVEDQDEFAKAIFYMVKEIQSQNSQSHTTDASNDFFDLLSLLNREEYLLFLFNPLDAYNSIPFVRTSGSSAQGSFACDSDIRFADGKADALRHAFLHALITSHVGYDFSVSAGNAHESGQDDPRAVEMDLHNNQIGRDLAIRNPQASDLQLLRLLIENSYLYVSDDDVFPNGYEGLIYINGRRPFDGTYSGELTNPKIGVNWYMFMSLSQCNTSATGEFDLSYALGAMKRRFSGSFTSSTTLSLQVSDPFYFESNGTFTYCRGMTMQLSGDRFGLEGTWVGTSCPVGGTVSLSRTSP